MSKHITLSFLDILLLSLPFTDLKRLNSDVQIHLKIGTADCFFLVCLTEASRDVGMVPGY